MVNHQMFGARGPPTLDELNSQFAGLSPQQQQQVLVMRNQQFLNSNGGSSNSSNNPSNLNPESLVQNDSLLAASMHLFFGCFIICVLDSIVCVLDFCLLDFYFIALDYMRTRFLQI